jgi:hypothetical protein
MNDYQTKICSKCKTSKPLSEFHKDRKKKCGHRSECRECNIQGAPGYARNYHLKNKEHRNALSREYYSKNREKKLKKNKNYRELNRESIRKKDNERTKSLDVNYIKRKIIGHDCALLENRDIPEGLVEIKRLLIQLKRELRNANKITQ